MTSRTPSILLRSLQGRLYGTVAAEVSQSSVKLSPQGAKVTKLQNGLTVASVENLSPVSHVGVIVNGGARCESGSDKGICHFLRDSTILSTQNVSALSMIRTIGQTGGNFGITSTREYMIYQAAVQRDHVGTVVSGIKEMTTAPAFKKWEMESGAVQDQMITDIMNLPETPSIKLLDLLHEAAYRDTLGNSLYCLPHMVNRFTGEQLMNYINTYYSQGRMGLVGVGVDHDEMVSLGKDWVLPGPANASSNKATFHGGEIRCPSEESMTHIAVVTEGSSLKSKDFFPLCVLQMIMGIGPQVKYSPNMSSRLNKAVSEAVKNPFGVTCLNANYTDSGLFGFYIVGQPKDMTEAMNAAMTEFKNVGKKGVTEQEVTRGKNQLKAAISMNRENNQNLFLDLAEQSLGSDKIVTTEDLLRMVDAVNPTEVNAVAKKVVAGKPALACLGDVTYVPYIE